MRDEGQTRLKKGDILSNQEQLRATKIGLCSCINRNVAATLMNQTRCFSGVSVWSFGFLWCFFFFKV